VEIDMSQQPEVGAVRQTLDAEEPKLRPVALAQLIATVTLALSTLIIATVVSIGLAHTAVAPTVTGPNTAPYAITVPPTDGEV
jgi:hypothetical protein